MLKSAIINIALAQPEPTGTNVGFERSWLLASAISHQDNQLWALTAPGVGKHENMGRMFSTLSPNDEGEFELEVGALLPDFLPNLDDQIDYTVPVTHNKKHYALCVSNQMMHLHYMVGGVAKSAIFPRILENEFREKAQLPTDRYPSIPLRSMATTRHIISGYDADDALTNHIESCLEIFISCVNNFMGACQAIDRNHFVYSSLLHSLATLGHFYIAVRGKDPDVIRTNRIAPKLGRAALMPPNLNAAESAVLMQELAVPENVTQPRRYMAYARIAENSGLLQFALLQAVIAAEVATANYIKQRLFASGVSKSKWEKLKSDVTYSQMLNLYLFALSPPSDKPDSQILGDLNRGRGIRNEVMHEGSAEISQTDLQRLLNSTEEYLAYLDRISASNSSS